MLKLNIPGKKVKLKFLLQYNNSKFEWILFILKKINEVLITNQIAFYVKLVFLFILSQNIPCSTTAVAHSIGAHSCPDPSPTLEKISFYNFLVCIFKLYWYLFKNPEFICDVDKELHLVVRIKNIVFMYV